MAKNVVANDENRKPAAIDVVARRRLDDFVRGYGEREAARRLGLTVPTLARAVAGWPLQKRTQEQLQTAFGISGEGGGQS